MVLVVDVPTDYVREDICDQTSMTIGTFAVTSASCFSSLAIIRSLSSSQPFSLLSILSVAFGHYSDVFCHCSFTKLPSTFLLVTFFIAVGLHDCSLLN